MGLFDDILKKPTPPAGQVITPTDPLMGSSGTQGAGQGTGQGAGSGGTSPVIVKSETSTVFGPNSEAEAIRSQNELPSVPTVHAEEDSSSILMPSSGASAPIAPVAPIMEPMVVTPIMEPSSVQAPVAPSNNDLASVSTPPAQPSAAPIENTPISVTAPAVTPNQDALQIPAGPSLFDHIMRDEIAETPVAPSVPVAPPAETTASVDFQFENSVPESAPIATRAVTTALDAPVQELSSSPDTHMTQASNYATPREFIEKSIENLDEMLETIDERHTAKMTEAEGYRMEKMRFAELEKNAYAEAEIMDRERDHTVRMRSIFEKELDTDEANRNKKTVAHTELHAEKHVHAHKRHVEEEDLIAAS